VDWLHLGQDKKPAVGQGMNRVIILQVAVELSEELAAYQQ